MQKNSKIHFIGIAGVGMGAVALMLKREGYFISGSDEGFYEPAASFLKKNNINILTPYKKENIPKDVDLIVIGKHSKLDPKNNEEVKEALKFPEKVRSFPQILAELTKNRENIVVAGSSGKSTCAALLAWCLTKSGVDVGYFFGAILIGFDKNANLGKEKYFILEGDEYPAWNGVSKFLYLNPKYVLLTSIEHDHVNIFPTFESYMDPFKKLIAKLPKDGLLVAKIDNPHTSSVLDKSLAKVVTYGTNNAIWHAENIKFGEKTTFDLFKNQEKIVELSTMLLGKHNIENIVGVSAFILEKNLITTEQLKSTVSKFMGIRRRLDLKTEKSSLLIYEGFGSSYAKAKTAIECMKVHFPEKKLIVIFEPHSFSWRNKNNLKWYQDVFDQNDETLIFNPPDHGQNTHEQASLEEILANIKNTKTNAYGITDKKEAFKILERIAGPNDIILLLSSGDMGGLIETIPSWAEKKFPK